MQKPWAIQDQEPGFRFHFTFDARVNSQETRLLTLNPQELTHRRTSSASIQNVTDMLPSA